MDRYTSEHVKRKLRVTYTHRKCLGSTSDESVYLPSSQLASVYKLTIVYFFTLAFTFASAATETGHRDAMMRGDALLFLCLL